MEFNLFDLDLGVHLKMSTCEETLLAFFFFFFLMGSIVALFFSEKIILDTIFPAHDFLFFLIFPGYISE